MKEMLQKTAGRVALVALAWVWASSVAWASPAQAGELPWVVEADRAAELVEGGATVLDARGKSAFVAKHIEGAQRAPWQAFSKAKKSERGELLGPKVVQAKLRALGVSEDRPVLVVGDPKGGWGEEGRIVWMLRTLGHTSSAMVDGGHAALVAAGAPTARGPARPATPGTFTASPTSRYRADAQGLRRAMDEEGVVIIDTREAREYAGKTPYGESRGGHVPGAVHLHYSELLGPDGRLLPAAKIRARLQKLGVEGRGHPHHRLLYRGRALGLVRRGAPAPRLRRG